MRRRRSSNFQDEQEDVLLEQTSTLAAAVGLKIVTQHTKLPSNVVVKQNKFSTKNDLIAHHHHRHRPVQTNSLDDFTCYLQSCQLCRKELLPDKDIYMYRGDQGFCSEKCRNRQIVMDEMRELEASTKKMLGSRHCYSDGPKSEARLLLEELFERRSQIPVRKTRAVIS